MISFGRELSKKPDAIKPKPKSISAPVVRKKCVLLNPRCKGRFIFSNDQYIMAINSI